MNTEIRILCVCVCVCIYIYICIYTYTYISLYIYTILNTCQSVEHLNIKSISFRQSKNEVFHNHFYLSFGNIYRKSKIFPCVSLSPTVAVQQLIVCSSFKTPCSFVSTHTLAKMPSKSAQNIYTVTKSTEGRLSSLMVFGPEQDHLLISVGVVEEYIIFISLFLLWPKTSYFVYLLTTCFFFLLL